MEPPARSPENQMDDQILKVTEEYDCMSSRQRLPPYTYVPGGPWPHPTRAPGGHSWGRQHGAIGRIVADQWQASAAYLRGVALFNAGYYWEAHESWEVLWHAHGRRGPTAELLQGLIKLAAAGVKVREGRPAGVRVHGSRAASLFEKSRRQAGRLQLGLDLEECSRHALDIATNPPLDDSAPGCPVTCVFAFVLRPRTRLEIEPSPCTE